MTARDCLPFTSSVSSARMDGRPSCVRRCSSRASKATTPLCASRTTSCGTPWSFTMATLPCCTSTSSAWRAWSRTPSTRPSSRWVRRRATGHLPWRRPAQRSTFASGGLPLCCTWRAKRRAGGGGDAVPPSGLPGACVQLFETGVDEMSWDDLSRARDDWPPIEAITEYRRQAYQVIRKVRARWRRRAVPAETYHTVLGHLRRGNASSPPWHATGRGARLPASAGVRPRGPSLVILGCG